MAEQLTAEPLAVTGTAATADLGSCALETAVFAAAAAGNPTPAPTDNLPPPGLTELITLWWQQWRLQVHQQVQLLSLEAQRAAQSLLQMLMLTLVMAFLLISGWLGLLGLVVILLQHYGWSLPLSMGLVLLLHGLALIGCVFLIRRQSGYLCFPASVNCLKPTAAQGQTDEHTEK